VTPDQSPHATGFFTTLITGFSPHKCWKIDYCRSSPVLISPPRRDFPANSEFSGTLTPFGNSNIFHCTFPYAGFFRHTQANSFISPGHPCAGISRHTRPNSYSQKCRFFPAPTDQIFEKVFLFIHRWLFDVALPVNSSY